MTNETPITPAELRAAFKRSGLWRLGWTYAMAVNSGPVYRALVAAAKAAQNAETAQGEVLRQASLFTPDLTRDG